jgi:hypothetical protein
MRTCPSAMISRMWYWCLQTWTILVAVSMIGARDDGPKSTALLARVKGINDMTERCNYASTRKLNVWDDLSVSLQCFWNTIARPAISVEVEDVLIMCWCWKACENNENNSTAYLYGLKYTMREWSQRPYCLQSRSMGSGCPRRMLTAFSRWCRWLARKASFVSTGSIPIRMDKYNK